MKLGETELRYLIESRPGDLFALDYVKANGEQKRINAQWGADKKQGESKLPYNPSSGGNIVLFDCAANGCRTYKLANIVGISYGDGVKYEGPAAGRAILPQV